MEDPDESQKRRTSMGARRNPASQQAILDAAEAVLAEEGLAGFSIEKVARVASAGKPTIYRWWPSRTALLLDVYRRYKSTRPFPDTGTLAGDLERFLSTQLLGLWQQEPAGTVFRSIIAQAQTDPDAAALLSAYESDRRAYSQIMVERAKARGEIEATTNGALIIDMAVAFAWHRLLTGRLERSAGDVAHVVRMILDGIKKSPGST